MPDRTAEYKTTVWPTDARVRSRSLLDTLTHPDTIERLATLMDDAFRVPGTRWRFGWDGVIGLIPGVGDAATAVVALVPVAAAWRLGASRWVIARMLANVAVDSAVGALPVVGDAFDFYFKANRRNARLLRRVRETRPRGG